MAGDVGPTAWVRDRARPVHELDPEWAASVTTEVGLDDRATATIVHPSVLGAYALVSDTRSYLGLARSRPKTLARLRARLAVVHDDSYRSRRFQIVLDDWMRLDLAGQILDDRHLTAEEFDRLTGRYRLSGPPA
jgi:hypothetical protein